MTRRRWIALAVLIALVVASALLAGPGASAPLASSAGPEGTLAMRRFLDGMGFSTSDGDVPSGTGDVFVILADLRTSDEAEAVLDWVSRGGRLILGDPASVFAAEIGAGPVAPIGGLSLRATLQPGCLSADVVGVERIAVLPSDAAVASDRADAVGCFPRGDGAFEVTVPVGAGVVVVLGGFSPFTNELLRLEDNAAYVLRLMAGRRTVVFGAPLPPSAASGRSGGIWEALPTPARVVLIQIVLAAAIFALVRARRLGRPVIEEPLSPIPAGQLVRATGRLYRSARAAGFAGGLLRRRAADRMRRRLGAPETSSLETLVRAVAARGLPDDRVRDVLGGPGPANDGELIALAKDLDDLIDRMEEARR